MATINLGNIKFNWKGTYNAGTAYAVDDVVSYNGSSYVCILASTGNLPTNTTYWNVMSSAGTNGTDLTSTLTTQGDIVYRDGSGLARLGAGTNGYFLKTQGTSANPVWSEVVSGNSPSFYAYMSGNQTGYAQSTWYDIPFNTEVWDTDNALSVSNTDNYQFVVPSGKAGKYVFDGYIRFYGAGGGHSTADSYNVKMRKKPSGGSYADYSTQILKLEPDIDQQGVIFTFGADLAVGDAVNLQMFSDQGTGTYNIAGASVHETFWKGMKIG
tara:strand:+ start:450 stop:1256 length:807 start_codon:yes stop_codon:yes gene_type:complete